MPIANGFDLPEESVYDLVRAVYRASDAFPATHEETFPDLAAFSHHLHALRQRPGHIFVVARQEETLTGFLIIEPRAAQRVSHIADIRSGTLQASFEHDTEHRMLDSVLRQLVDESILETVYVSIRADQPDRIRAYDKVGFERKAVLKNDIKLDGKYYDTVLMSLDLLHFNVQRRFGGSLQMGDRQTLNPTSP